MILYIYIHIHIMVLHLRLFHPRETIKKIDVQFSLWTNFSIPFNFSSRYFFLLLSLLEKHIISQYFASYVYYTSSTFLYTIYFILLCTLRYLFFHFHRYTQFEKFLKGAHILTFCTIKQFYIYIYDIKKSSKIIFRYYTCALNTYLYEQNFTIHQYT